VSGKYKSNAVIDTFSITAFCFAVIWPNNPKRFSDEVHGLVVALMSLDYSFWN